MNIIKLTYTQLAGCLMFAAITSCSSAEISPTLPDATPLMITSADPSFTADVFSRDGGLAYPEDPDSYTPVIPAVVGVYADMQGYTTGHIFNNDRFYYKLHADYNVVGPGASMSVADSLQQILGPFVWPPDNNWVYAPVQFWSQTSLYHFYAYAPYRPFPMTEIDNQTYGGYQTLTMSDLPPFSPYDIMVADRYRQQTGGVVPINMAHITGRLCVRLKIGEKYSRLRSIVVTEVAITDRREGATFFDVKSEFTTDPADLAITIVPTTTYTPSATSEEINLIPIFNNPAGLELSAVDYQQYGSLYVLPQNLPSITINVTYDVYDLEGNLTRKDQHATNTHLFPNDRRDIRSGYYRDINVLISPAFLYVLSDNDVEPDVLIDIPNY